MRLTAGKVGLFLCLAVAGMSLVTDRAQACTMSSECIESLAQRESSGNYSAVNQYNFLGRYQFGEAALIDAGYYTHDGTSASCPSSQGGCDWRGTWTGRDGIHSREQFLASQTAQDNALAAYQAATWRYIQSNGLDQYLGQTIGGIPITCDNLLTGYHLKGSGGLRAFLGSNGANDPADANGTRISEYLDLGADCSGMGTGVMQSANTQTSCDQNILTTGQQLREASMNLEKGIIDQMVQKPQSVMELSCFDQFGEMFNQEIGKIFSDIDSSFQPLTNAFPGIFQDAQQSIVGEMSGALFGDRAQSFGSQISSQLSSAFSSIFGGGGNVEYGCEVMETLWKVLQCEDMFSFEIPSIRDLIGGSGASFMDGLMPDSCTGKALFDGAIQAADQVFSDFGGNVPSQLSPSNIESLIRSY